MTLRKLRNWFFSLVALLLILLATLSALVETQTGSRWVVNRLAGLAGGLRCHGAGVEDDGVGDTRLFGMVPHHLGLIGVEAAAEGDECGFAHPHTDRCGGKSPSNS